MVQPNIRFPRSEIISLVGDAPRFDLAESLGPAISTAALDLTDMPLRYGSAAGDPALRRAVADVHGVDPDDVVITVGSMHALFLLAFTLCRPGDEAVVASPLFPLARNALIAVGAEVRTLQFSFERGYTCDLRELRRLLSTRTRLVSIASPQNPSGVTIPVETLREIVALLQEHAPRAQLLLDEAYREAAQPAADSGIALGANVVVVGSLSKCHGAPGLRIGWVITRDAALREQLVTAKFNTVISCSPLDEALAVQVLRQRTRILEAHAVVLRENRELVAAWVKQNADRVSWVRPDAGALCCVQLRAEVFDDAAVERFYAALTQHGVRVAPGHWFGESARVFRVGFGALDAAQLRAALELMSDAASQATVRR